MPTLTQSRMFTHRGQKLLSHLQVTSKRAASMCVYREMTLHSLLSQKVCASGIASLSLAYGTTPSEAPVTTQTFVMTWEPSAGKLLQIHGQRGDRRCLSSCKVSRIDFEKAVELVKSLHKINI